MATRCLIIRLKNVSISRIVFTLLNQIGYYPEHIFVQEKKNCNPLTKFKIHQQKKGNHHLLISQTQQKKKR